MRKSMKQRVALFLSFAMAFTSVDSSVLAAAADTTEVVSEEAQQEAAVEEEAVVQQEETAVEEAVVQQEDAAVEEAVVLQEDAVVEEEVQQEEAAVEEAQQEDAAVDEEVQQEEETAPAEEAPVEEELTVDEQPAEDQAAEETGEEQQEESASAEDTLTEETESVEEEGTEEAETDMDAITEEEDSIEEQIIGEELYDLEEESVAVDESIVTMADEDSESFADSVASATPLEFDADYTVKLDAKKTYEWFSYTAQEETTVVFMATTENDSSVDNYVEVYDGREMKIAYDDDSAKDRNFSVKVTIPAGETYYFKARMYDEGDEGTFQVSLRKTVEIKKITVKELKTQSEIAGLETKLGHETVYTIQYTSGKEDDVEISGVDYKDLYGNTIEYRFDLENSNRACFYGTYKPEGKYKLTFLVDEKEMESTDYVFEAIDVENANLPELTLGSNKIQSGENSNIWYKLEAKAGTKYRIDKCDEVSIYTQIENNMECVTSGYNGITFKAEQDGTYYLGFRGSCWDSEKQEDVYEWTVNLQEVPEITAITSVTPATTSILAGLPSNYLGYGTEYTISYSNGTEETIMVEDDGYYRDSYGNYIEYSFHLENSEDTYGYWASKPEGKYALSFILNGEENSSTGYVFESIDPAGANLPELTLGSNKIQSGENSNIWYKFEAKAGTRYLIDKCDYMAVYTKKEKNMEYVTSGNSSAAFKAEQKGTYYLGFMGECWDSEKQESVYEWTANLKEVPEIVSITPGILATTSILADLPSKLGYGTEYTISYSNETEETVSIGISSAYWDSYGNYISYRFKQENSEETYDYWDSKPKGKYALSFILNGEEIASTGYIFEAIDPTGSNLPELTVGSNKINSGEGNYNWYQFKAKANTRYTLDTCSSLTVYTKQDGEMKCISDTDDGAFTTEQEGTYYLGFLGCIWGEDDEQIYEWTTELKEVPKITSITIDTCKTTSNIAELQSNLGCGTEYTINYSNETSESVIADYRGSYRDPYRNYISGRFIPENDEENRYDWTDSKPEGKYALVFYVNGEEKARTEYIFECIDVEKANLPELKEGANAIESGKNEAIWYQFKAAANTSYMLDKCDQLSVYIKEDDKMKQITSGHSGTFQTGQEGIYYLGFEGSYWDSEEGVYIYEWTANLSAVPELSTITVDSYGITSITAGLQTNLGEGTEYTVHYSDGAEAKAVINNNSYTDVYKNSISYYFIPESKKDDEEENWYAWTDLKPEGKYALEFYVYGKEVYKTDYVFECVNAEQSELPELKTGKNIIQSGENDYNWYRFKAEETGKYRFSDYGEEMAVRRYDAVAQKWESLFVSRGGFEAEANETYYIGFRGENESEDNVYSYTWETQLSKVQSVKSISVIPKKTSFNENTYENHALFSLKLTYDDGTEFTCENWRDSRYDVDGKGNGIEVHIVNKKDYEEADSYYWHSERDSLQAGTYIVFVKLIDDDSVRATYNITIEEEPSPFNHKADVIPVTMETEYPVELNTDKLAEWFSYTPDHNTEIIYQSIGEYDTYGHIYDAKGNELKTNDDGGTGSNFKITTTLTAGETYYFKARFYDRGNQGNFVVSFKERLQISSLTVAENELKSAYLKNGSLPNPSVLLTATYNKNGVSETFYRSKGDSYGNKITGEVRNAEGNVVKKLEEVGIYSYWVRCGEVTAKVGEFEAKSVKDLASQEVTEDAEQQITAKEQRLAYHFEVEEAGIYQMNANVEFSNLRIYDTEGSEVELSGTQNGYTAYAALSLGEYYVVAGVTKEIKKLRVTVKKAVLPQEVTAVFDGTPLIAGLDSLESNNLSTRVKYTDNTTGWIAGRGSDSYGNEYTYVLDDGDDDEYWGLGDALPAGTYTVEPVVFRTGTYISWATPDNNMLNEVLKEENRKATMIEVVKPDSSGMTAVQENEWVTVAGNSRRYFYKFTPQESGTYIFEYNDDTTSSNVFCRDYEYKLSRMGRRPTLTAGQTYVIVATRTEDYDFRIVKYTKDTSGTEKETKTIQSFQISSSQPYVLSYDIFEPLSLKVTYTDGITASISMPQADNEDNFWSVSDGYGNSFKCKEVPKITEEQNGKYVLFTVVCKEKEATLKLPYYTLEEKAIEVSIENPVKDTRERYFKITPQESGEYIFRITAKEWGARIYSFRNESMGNSISYTDGNGENWQTTKTLSKGKTYYFKVVNESDNQKLAYTVSVLKPKNISDLKITEYAKDYKVFEGIAGSGNTGIKALVTYEDGSTETVTEYQISGSGRVLNISKAFWVNTQIYRVVVKFGKYSAQVDIPTSNLVYTAELKENAAITSNGDMNVYSFTPSATEVYQVRAEGSGYFNIAVYNSITLKEVEEVNATYELLANTKYNVVVYHYNGDNAPYSVTIGREQKHTHSYKEEIVEKATCETTGYKQQVCSICGKVKDGSRTELPATGHKWETKVDKAATCGAEGSQHKECSVCHTKEAITTIPATGKHNMQTKVDKVATCGAVGSQHKECSVCHTKEAATTIPATGKHNMQTKVDKAATCGAAGSQHRECSVCHTKEALTTIPATGKHNMQTIVDKAATCGAAGSQHRECSVCHTKEAATTIPATGKHSFGGYVVTKEATVFAAGTETRTCKVCGTTESRSIAQLAATIKLTAVKVTVKVGDSAEVGKYVTGLAKGDSVASYTSSNKKAATVSKTGKVTGKAAGTAKITVKLASGKTADITVTVQKKEIATKSIKNLSKTMKIKLKGTAQLKPVISPSNTTDKLTYASSDKKIVTVSAKGKLTAKKVGKAKITVQSGKKKFTITVTVAAPTPTGMKNVPTSKKLAKGKSFVLKPTLLPAGATGKITYKTSDKKIVTVDAKGKVTAKGKGSAVITVTVGKVKKTCKVTVK